jgi:hypothetical protein
MDPYLGPVAGALLAALGAGVALGVVRLRRLSLAWWRRRRAAPPASATAAAEAAGAAGAAAAAAVPGPEDTPGIAPAVAPPVFAALAAIAAVAVVVAGLSFVSGAARPLAPPTWSGSFVVLPGQGGPPPSLAARVSSVAGFAVLVVVATLGLALAAAALDRGLGRVAARFVRRKDAAAERPDGERLTVTDLVATARALLPGAPQPARGEPFGVGLAYIVLFAAATLGVGALLSALVPGTRPPAPGPGSAALAALALLATPALYAAAAERSHDPLRARLRRDAAVRQLAAAPVWLVAGAVIVARSDAPGSVFVPLVAAALFVVSAAAALPGAGADPSAWNAPPLGGDRAEPAAAVRALTGIAHYAWLVVLATLPFVARDRGIAGVPWTGLGLGALMLVLFLAARVALRLRPPVAARASGGAPA